MQTKQRESLPFTAMLLAGGLGTRLRSVVSDRPKVMAAVGEVPFLQILVDSLAHKGVRDFVLLTGHMREDVERHFLEHPRDEVRIRVSPEEAPLGTGGAVKNAERFCTEPTLVVYGDSFFDADVGALLRFHLNRGGDVTLCLARVDDVRRYGAVQVDPRGVVTGFYEKDQSPEGPGYINAGFYFVTRRFVEGLPRDRAFSMEQEIFPSVAREGRMFGLPQEGAFFDIGTPESYREFQHFVQSRES